MTELERDEAPADQPVAEATGGIFSNAPWWMVSAGIHVVVLLAATLVAIEQTHALDGDKVEILVHAPVNEALISQIEPVAANTTQNGAPQEDPTEKPSRDIPIFFPEAKPSDHNESADGEDFHEMKGDSKEFLTYTKGEAGGFRGRQMGKVQGVYDAMGVGKGGGGGGRYGGRRGGRENLRATGPGPTKGTEGAVLAALKWLAHHQGGDGGWGAESYVHQCTGGRCSGAGDSSYDTGVTGLAVLAFLGAGYTPVSKDEYVDPIDSSKKLYFGAVVKKGLQWLLSHQDPEGCIGERGTKYMYNHCVAALALSEAYGMTASAPLKDPAQKAIDFLVAAQNPGKGWRYTVRSGDNDSSVSGWAVMALKSAELSDLQFPKTAFDGAINWFSEATSAKDGYYRVGYNQRDTGKVYVPGKNELFDDHPALSAVAVMSRIFIQKSKKEPALTAVQLLVSDLPEWKQYKVDFYYWYYASLALFQYDGPDGGLWTKWNEPMKNAIVPHQKGKADGCRLGSWDSEEDRWGFEGGRVYATAINALTLEVYYRYANVFGGGQGKK